MKMRRPICAAPDCDGCRMKIALAICLISLAVPARAQPQWTHAQAQDCLAWLSLAMSMEGLNSEAVAQAHHSLTLLVPMLAEPDFPEKVAERTAAETARLKREEALAAATDDERPVLIAALEQDVAGCLVPATTGTDLPAP